MQTFIEKRRTLDSAYVEQDIRDLSNRIWSIEQDTVTEPIHPTLLKPFIIDKDIYIVGSTLNSSYKLTPWAIQQLSAIIGLNSTNYINKCIESDKADLALTNINRWLSDYIEASPKAIIHLVESKEHSEVIGMVSDKFKSIQNSDIFNQLIYQLKDYKIQSYNLSHESFNLRMVNTKNLNILDEDLFIGFNVWNSNVGKSSLNVSILIYKLVCTNGMTIKRHDIFNYTHRHVGISIDGFTNTLSEILLQLPQLVEYITNKIIKAKQTPLSEEVQNYTLARFKTKTRVSDKFIEDVLKILNAKYESTIYGLVNAITEKSQYLDMHQQDFIEQVASTIIFN